MANRKRDAGREALEKKGWWRSHRWLVLRRLCQFFVLGMFLSGPWFGVWILHGNYSSSLLFDTVPLNPITDLANWLRRRFDLNQSATIPRHIRYVLLVVILLGSALTGTLIWEWINPVSLMGRSLVMGFGSGALLILALFLFDLLVVEHGWCGHICPVGALYGVLGSKGVITVAATDRQKCNRCMDCFHVCPEPHVLRAPVLDEQSPVQVTSRDCMTCGRCVDVCSEDVFTITTRWSSGAKS